MDADIIAHPDLLRHHLEAHLADPDAIVLGCLYAVAISAETWNTTVRDAEQWNFSNVSDLFNRAAHEPRLQDRRISWMSSRGVESINHLPAPWLCVWTGNVSLSRQVFERVGLLDEQMSRSSDLDLGYRLWRERYNLTFNQLACGFHYPHHRDYASDENLDRSSALYMLEKYSDPCMEILAKYQFDDVMSEIEKMNRMATYQDKSNGSN